jgi:cell division septation protein DedD
VVAVIASVAIGITALKIKNNDDGANPADSTAQSSPSATKAAGGGVPADERCSAEIKANERWVCLISAKFKGNTLTIKYQANFAGDKPDVNGGYHLHIYGGDGTTPAAETEGRHAIENRGTWYEEDQKPSVRTASSKDYRTAIGDAPKVCARIADSIHSLVLDKNNTVVTGNCVPIDRSGYVATAQKVTTVTPETGTPKGKHSTATPTATPTTDPPTPTPTPTWTPSALVAKTSS